MEWDLISRCRDGSTTAFEPLVREHESRALAIAEALLGDADDAADAVQEAFVKAYRSLRRLREGSAFGPWFRTILRNQCRDQLRAAPNRNRVEWDDAVIGESGHAEPGGVRSLERTELSLAVQCALARLSTEHREILVLKEMEGMSYAEIAEETGVPAGTVASRLHHARMALKKILIDTGISLEGAGT